MIRLALITPDGLVDCIYACAPDDADKQHVPTGWSLRPCPDEVLAPGGQFANGAFHAKVVPPVTLTAVQTSLLRKVKSEAERRKMGSFSAGNAKAQEYVQKGKEAVASATVLASVLNSLTVANAAAQYPMAHAERTVTGETLSVVLARYRAGKASSDAELARLSAIEWKAVQAIKAATTAAAKQAAFSSINWNQSV